MNFDFEDIYTKDCEDRGGRGGFIDLEMNDDGGFKNNNLKNNFKSNNFEDGFGSGDFKGGFGGGFKSNNCEGGFGGGSEFKGGFGGFGGGFGGGFVDSQLEEERRIRQETDCEYETSEIMDRIKEESKELEEKKKEKKKKENEKWVKKYFVEETTNPLSITVSLRVMNPPQTVVCSPFTYSFLPKNTFANMMAVVKQKFQELVNYDIEIVDFRNTIYEEEQMLENAGLENRCFLMVRVKT
jgi:hypothetical protein